MVRIRITPDQVRQVAQQFKNASGESEGMVQRLQSALSGLESEWEGMTKQRFYQEFEQWKQTMTQFTQLLADIGQQLDAIAARFEAADQG